MNTGLSLASQEHYHISSTVSDNYPLKSNNYVTQLAEHTRNGNPYGGCILA